MFDGGGRRNRLQLRVRNKVKKAASEQETPSHSLSLGKPLSQSDSGYVERQYEPTVVAESPETNDKPSEDDLKNLDKLCKVWFGPARDYSPLPLPSENNLPENEEPQCKGNKYRCLPPPCARCHHLRCLSSHKPLVIPVSGDSPCKLTPKRDDPALKGYMSTDSQGLPDSTGTFGIMLDSADKDSKVTQCPLCQMLFSSEQNPTERDAHIAACLAAADDDDDVIW